MALGLAIKACVGGTVFMLLACSGPRGQPEHATVLPQPMALPPFSLLDQHGAPFDKESFAGHWSLVFFGFTNCPDICPATLQQLVLARSRMLHNSKILVPHIVLVSVDPERDTPETMAAYVEHFGAGITGVSGRLEELHKLTSALGIYFEKSAGDDGSYSVAHSAVVIVVNPRAEFQAVFRAPHRSEHFVDDLPRIAGST